jgi:hypothetical protein
MAEQRIMDEVSVHIPTVLEAVQGALDMEDGALDMEAIAEAAARAVYQPDAISFETLKLLIARLAQLLAQEADYLDAMQIAGVASLQTEKKALVDALEKQKKLITRRSRMVGDMTDDQYDDLYRVVEVFNLVLGENHKRLMVAKEINARVVEAITELANENAKQGFYTHKGERSGDPSVSLSLNRSI